MRLIQDQGFERAAIQGETIFQVGPSWAAGILIEETSSDKACRKSGRAITCFNVGWDWPAQKLGLVVGCGYPGSVPIGVLPRARCRWAGRLRPR